MSNNISFSFPAERTDIARAIAAVLLTTVCGDEHATTDSFIVQNVKRAEERESAKDVTIKDVDPADGALNEYEQAAIDAVLAEDQYAEFTHEDVRRWGENMCLTYTNFKGKVVSLSVAAGVLAEQGNVVEVLAQQRSIAGKLLQSSDDASTAALEGDAKLDEKGVTFCDKHCAAAAEPFYGSGKRKGQWKKRRGVSDEEYDAWYESALASARAGGDKALHVDTHVDTTAAFSGTQSTSTPEPQNLGELMAWVSAQQTAGNVTQELVNSAYSACGLTDIAQLFQATPEAQLNYIGAIFATLSA